MLTQINDQCNCSIMLDLFIVSHKLSVCIIALVHHSNRSIFTNFEHIGHRAIVVIRLDLFDFSMFQIRKFALEIFVYKIKVNFKYNVRLFDPASQSLGIFSIAFNLHNIHFVEYKAKI